MRGQKNKADSTDKKWRPKNGEPKGRELMVVSGTTLRVVVVLLAEMREQPGGSAYDVATFASVQTRVLAHFG